MRKSGHRFYSRILRAILLCALSTYTASNLFAAELLVGAGVRNFGGSFNVSLVDKASIAEPIAIADTGLLAITGTQSSGAGYAAADFQSGVMAASAFVMGPDTGPEAQSGGALLDVITFDLPDGMTTAQVTLSMDMSSNFNVLGRTRAEGTLRFGDTQVNVMDTLTGASTGQGEATLTVTDGQSVTIYAFVSARALEPLFTPAHMANVRTQAIVRLDTPAGVTYSSESGIVFTAAVPDGGSVDSPILPAPGTGGVIGIDPCRLWQVICFVDPLVAVGYEFILDEGLSGIASILLPSNFGDGLYQLFLYDALTGTYSDSGQQLVGGQVFSFTELLGLIDGLTRFQIRGIETDAMLDPNDFTRFVTGLTFVGNNLSGFLTMNPLTQEVGGTVPEPNVLHLVLLALCAVSASRRIRGRRSQATL